MKFPVGDIVRALNPKGWIGKIFQWTKGISIKWGNHEIMLDEQHGINRKDPAPFNKPHRP